MSWNCSENKMCKECKTDGSNIVNDWGDKLFSGHDEICVECGKYEVESRFIGDDEYWVDDMKKYVGSDKGYRTLKEVNEIRYDNDMYPINSLRK